MYSKVAETYEHKKLINEYIKNGFLRNGFKNFVKDLIYKSTVNDEKIESAQIECDINYSEAFDLAVDDYNEAISCISHIKLIPDCYRYDDDKRVLQVVEVDYHSPLNWSRLVDFSLIEEVLFTYAGIRFDLIEHAVMGNHIYVHHTSWVYDKYYEGLDNTFYKNDDASNFFRYIGLFKKSGSLYGDDIPEVWIN